MCVSLLDSQWDLCSQILHVPLKLYLEYYFRVFCFLKIVILTLFLIFTPSVFQATVG